MIEIEGLYRCGVIFVVAAASVTFPLLFFIDAPYGRHQRSGWGPSIPTRLAWVVMEAPAPIVFAVFFLRGEHHAEVVPWLLFGFWQLHYIQRTCVYPLLMRDGAKPTALVTFVMALFFNVLNGALNGIAVGQMDAGGSEWLGDPRFLIGAGVFLLGFAINLHSDAVLRNLRRPGESGYKIPHRGLFRWVSSANYFGEIVEWCGWALATWSAAGLAFALFTMANLLPRGIANHRWYGERFADYPVDRKAILPGLL